MQHHTQSWRNSNGLFLPRKFVSREDAVAERGCSEVAEQE